MSYIGNSITQQSFTGGMDQFNGNASNTAFGLSRTINTVYDLDVYVESVYQRPGVGYTVSANTITFTSAPASGSNNVVVVYKNFSATSIVPQQGSVTTSSFAANAIPATLGYVPLGNTSGSITSTLGYVPLGNTSGSITSTLGYTPANKAGDTFTGYVEVGNTVRVTSISNPASGSGMELAYDGTQGVIQIYTNRSTLASAPLYLGTGQLKFPASQNASSDANTLDDYEEGTWTPVNASIASITLSITSARYIKIGRLVFVTCYLSYPSTADTNQAKIGGFPFTHDSNNTYSYFSGRTAYSGSKSPVYWQLGNGGTEAGAYQSGAGTTVNNNDLTNNYVIFSGCYYTSS